MTPKEKAKELYDKFFDYAESITRYSQHNNTKQCALIAVDMAIEQFKGVFHSLKNIGILNDKIEDTENYKYWQQVKKEIEEL